MPGQLGALLRREGLSSSHLAAWRKQRDAASLEALATKRRGRKATALNTNCIMKPETKTIVRRTFTADRLCLKWRAVPNGTAQLPGPSARTPSPEQPRRRPRSTSGGGSALLLLRRIEF